MDEPRAIREPTLGELAIFAALAHVRPGLINRAPLLHFWEHDSIRKSMCRKNTMPSSAPFSWEWRICPKCKSKLIALWRESVTTGKVLP